MNGIAFARRCDLSLCYLVFALSFAFMIGSGLIPEWGRWYSGSLAYRHQTETMQNGVIALSKQATSIEPDWVWSNGGVQQVWGLGVPTWRLPFEAIARMLRLGPFPDRISFFMAIAIVAYWLMRLSSTTANNGPGEWMVVLRESPERIAGILMLLFFPPFVTMCRFRFWVYEEAEAYSYLYAIGLFAGVISFVKKSTVPKYVLLTVFAGLAPFVRPTLLFYGFASLLIAFSITRRSQWSWRGSFLGVLVFCIGGLLLFWSNHQRFGSGFEFGHKLNLNHIDDMRFASRFDYPFRQEPILSAAAELFGSVFLAGNSFNGYNWYQKDFFSGQSPTFRWREIYFTTYDLSYLAMAVCAWLLAIVCWIRKRRHALTREESPDEGEIRAMMMWSFVAAVPTALFYVRCPFITSRYLLDFAPAFAVAMLAFYQWIASVWVRRGVAGAAARYLLVMALMLWWVYQILAAKSAFPRSETLTSAELASMKAGKAAKAVPPPAQYEAGMFLGSGNDNTKYVSRFNGMGWSPSGETKAAVTLFVDDPQWLELTVAPASNIELSEKEYLKIQAKIGLEFLPLLRIEKSTNSVALRFQGPAMKMYQTGIQPLFLGFVAAEELNEGDSKFRLLKVRWRESKQ